MEAYAMSNEGLGVSVPDSALAKEITQFVRDTESTLLFNHSARVYLWGALEGERRKIRFDPELLYAAAMFHDIGLTPFFADSRLRFEVDGANAARAFLRSHSIPEDDVQKVWLAIALHTTPGVLDHLDPEIGLVQIGAGMDVAGRGYESFSAAQRDAVVAAYGRGGHFKTEMI